MCGVCESTHNFRYTHKKNPQMLKSGDLGLYGMSTKRKITLSRKIFVIPEFKMLDRPLLPNSNSGSLATLLIV